MERASPEARCEVRYFVEQPDTFGPEWMFGINIAPVVENVFAGWFD